MNTKAATPKELRIYVVKTDDKTTRYIKATSPAAAVLHAFKPQVHLAKQDELVGVTYNQIETAAA